MKEMIKMVVVLTLLSCISGGLLAALRDGTKEQIEMQELNLVKGPVIEALMSDAENMGDAENNPINRRFKIMDGETELTIFPGIYDGKPNTVAFEVIGNGFGGKLGLMLVVNLDTDTLVGAGVTTHTETPGLGGNAKADPSFAAQFKGLSFSEPIKVTKDGGSISAISGATVTSRAVCLTATDAIAVYQRIKPELESKIKEMNL
jgi:electron transport complex protein RnfG